jgi:hypothetical protein
MALLTDSPADQDTLVPEAPGPTAHQPAGGSASGGGLSRWMERLWVRPAWFAPLAVLVCFAGFSGLMLASDPTDGRPDPFGGCALKAVTGFDCPGCGGTRAFWYLVHGNLPEAARHHVFAVFAAPFLVYLYLGWAAQRMFNLTLPALPLRPRLVGGFFAAWGVFMVVRNLPWEPFTMLYV